MENDEYYLHRRGVDHMISTSYGNNMSINNYEKRKINVKPQEYKYHECDCNIRGSNGYDITPSELDRLWANKEQFILFVYLNQSEVEKKPDLETDLKMWMTDSKKIMVSDRLSEEEKIFHLPKKDFKIDFDKSHAILKNCKFAKIMSTSRDKFGKVPVNSFAMIVERIIFTKK